MERLAPTAGVHTSALPGVCIYRDDCRQKRYPAIYEPSILIVGQGRKRGHVGGEVFTYDANNYLVLSVPLPAECEILDATPERPYLCMRIDVDLALLGELLLAMADDLPPASSEVQLGIYSSPLREELHEATLRLLAVLQDPGESRVLGPQIVREIVYRVLRGEQSEALRTAALRHSRSGQIGCVLRRIHQDFAAPMDVDELAREAGMSVSTFHHTFRTVTSTSPIQYIKRIRLHRARALMLQQGMSVSVAASSVGYESASQFSREYKRLFGVSPAQSLGARA